MIQHNIINKLKEDIRRQVKEDVCVENIVVYSGYSLGHLQRIFKNEIGISLGRYIRKIKIECAAEEIINGRHPLLLISVDYGFSSQASFSRTFKSVMGIPPKKYREDNLSSLKSE